VGFRLLSTRITGIPELIEDGVDGLLVAAGDPEGLAAAIRRLIVNPELRIALGDAAREKVATQDTSPSTVPQWRICLNVIFLRLPDMHDNLIHNYRLTATTGGRSISAGEVMLSAEPPVLSEPAKLVFVACV